MQLLSLVHVKQSDMKKSQRVHAPACKTCVGRHYSQPVPNVPHLAQPGNFV